MAVQRVNELQRPLQRPSTVLETAPQPPGCTPTARDTTGKRLLRRGNTNKTCLCSCSSALDNTPQSDMGGGGGGQACVTRDEGGGGGSGTQKFVYQKWPKSIFPTASFILSHHEIRVQGGFPREPPPPPCGCQPVQYMPAFWGGGLSSQGALSTSPPLQLKARPPTSHPTQWSTTVRNFRICVHFCLSFHQIHLSLAPHPPPGHTLSPNTSPRPQTRRSPAPVGQAAPVPMGLPWMTVATAQTDRASVRSRGPPGAPAPRSAPPSASKSARSQGWA